MLRLVKPTITLLLGAAILTGCAAKTTPSVVDLSQLNTTLSPAQLQTHRELSSYYQRVERNLLTQGLLRRDGGSHDAPISAPLLAKNFERIALRQEYTRRGPRLIAKETNARLMRWRDPVRIALAFGPSVNAQIRHQDQELMAHYSRRLARVSGHPISMTLNDANFTIFVVNDAERKALEPVLRQVAPHIDQIGVNAVTNMPRDTYCLVIAMDSHNSGEINQAIAVIRAEHPKLMRTSCLHEEVAQGLGLSNDHPKVRPSIFNDDEEFGLLTTHDEMLLRILYDPRLTPGQNAEDVRENVAIIAQEILQTNS